MSLKNARTLPAAAALSLAACFTGKFLAGQPCASDAECGPSLRCEEGRCGGASATASESGEATTTSTSTSTTSTAGTTAPETTSTAEPTTGTTEPVTTTIEPTTTSTTTGESTSTTGAACGIGRCADIDFLMVVDNSPSMGDKTDTMVAVLLAIGETILPELKDACSVHIGLVTTDEYEATPEECRQLGALVRTDNDGAPCAFAEGHPYATEADLGNPASIACVALVGSGGDPNERQFDALLRVFDAPLNNGCNDGFRRPGAFLAVLFATDEDDGDDDPQMNAGSDMLMPTLWPSSIVTLAGGIDNLYVAALLGDEDARATACPWTPLEPPPDGSGASSAPVLRAFIDKLPEDHREIASLCQQDPDPANFAPLMETVLNEIRSVCGG